MATISNIMDKIRVELEITARSLLQVEILIQMGYFIMANSKMANVPNNPILSSMDCLTLKTWG
jgi:hypothetical protein